jgi:hypothetical protein
MEMEIIIIIIIIITGPDESSAKASLNKMPRSMDESISPLRMPVSIRCLCRRMSPLWMRNGNGNNHNVNNMILIIIMV